MQNHARSDFRSVVDGKLLDVEDEVGPFVHGGTLSVERSPSFMSRTQRSNRTDEDTIGTAIRIIADSRQNHLEGRSPAFANVD